MIYVDIHTHTSHAHGASSVREMFEAGQKYGLKVHGFSEHSPRPLRYNYTNEYREHLAKHFPFYLQEVEELKRTQKDCQVLLGLELDWFEDEVEFVQNCAKSHDFDYIIAGIHFIGTWGFDDQASHWDILSYEEKCAFYTKYYQTMIKMAQSNIFDVLAHPDLIKIFSKEDFHTWLPHNLGLVREALKAVKEAGMLMEISSAGLRKPCAEIYPCPQIMEIAKELELNISFASDGHCINTIAKDFDILEDYAKQYGYTKSAYPINKKLHFMDF